MPEQVPVRSVRTGGTDYIEVPTPEEQQVAALRREHAGYLTRGLGDRAEQVAAELRRLGADVEEGQEQRETPRVPEPENTADSRPLQRTARRGRRE
ncbi:hypothetical protein [Streptosporangium carneum]|uniref:Uncharacterized protein n=1 Tax=Streptosporangium carneum TaxID=47481 RepID=A0A9W6HXP6_9ACTN|nr:hypothetical protein [Streptosporangium carneum]GLK07310.1 hypothetical protein GCM10017600_07150 [Streptosporangium carneum]